MAPQKPRRLGEILLERGWITHEQLFRALEKQQLVGGRLGTSLVEIEALSEELLLQALAEQQRSPSAGIDELRSIPAEILNLVPARIAARCRAIPFRVAGSQVHVAMIDVKNLAFQDELAFVTAKRIKVYICSEARISEALEKFYDQQCSTRIAQLLDRLNRARYLWDRGVEKPIEPAASENSTIFQSAERALGAGPGTAVEAPARPKLARAPQLPAAPAMMPAQGAPAPPSFSAPRTRPALATPVAKAAPFETRVLAPEEPEVGPAPASFAAQAGTSDPRPALADITLVVASPSSPSSPSIPASMAGAADSASPAAPAPSRPAEPPRVVEPTPPAALLSPSDFETRLLSGEDREDVGQTLVRYLAQSFSRVALFVVRQDSVTGWLGHGPGLDRKALAAFRVDLAQPSVFLSLRQGGDYFLGPLSPMPVHRDLARCWGGEMPRDCLVLPIRLKGRLVTLAYADRGPAGLAGLDISQMQHVAAKATIAFELCIMRNKLRNA